MTPDLLEYFQRELQFLDLEGKRFGRLYPDIAGALEVDPAALADPHAERMLQAFAWLNARIQLSLDRDLSHLTDAFFSVVLPDLQRPVPSCAVAQLSLRQPGDIAPTGIVVPRGSTIVADEHRGVSCRFQTSFPVELRPLELGDVTLSRFTPEQAPAGMPQARAMLRLRLSGVPSGRAAPLEGLGRLRLFLQGPRTTTFPLYELLVRDTIGMSVTGANGRSAHLRGPGLIDGAGFTPGESLCPWPARSPQGLCLLREFFAFPEKHLFVDACRLGEVAAGDWGEYADVALYFDRPMRELEADVGPGTLRLHCTPIVNLFPLRAEPIPLTHERESYRVVAAARWPEEIEIYSVDHVTAVSADRSMRLPEMYEPPRPDGTTPGSAAWMTLRPSQLEDRTRSEVRLALSDPQGDLLAPDTWTLDVETTCLNGDLPASLPFQGPGPRLQFAHNSPAELECIVSPTRRIDVWPRDAGRERLAAMLALQSLPLFCQNPPESRLHAWLEHCDPVRSRETRALIDGLAGVEARPVQQEISVQFARCFGRGVEVWLECDETRYPGSSAYLFAAVVEQFLALTSAVNCLTRVLVRSSETRRVRHRFPTRGGGQTLTSFN